MWNPPNMEHGDYMDQGFRIPDLNSEVDYPEDEYEPEEKLREID